VTPCCPWSRPADGHPTGLDTVIVMLIKHITDLIFIEE
jgi:hypothetical protein